MQRRGLLIILSSPSGAGKSTMAKRLMAWDPSLKFSVSATTRAPRPGEIDGVDYQFTSKAEFERMVEAEEMLEHAEVFGNFYGTPKGPVEAAMMEGRDTLFDIDWQGGQQVRRSTLAQNVLSIFILPPSIEALESRLRARGQDSDEVIALRMSEARDEISHWAEYDYVIVNDDPDQAEEELKTIVKAERARADRMPGLNDFVRGLNKEFEARQIGARS
ncbi:guanylate kinase [Pararhodobacter oceanensis]|uniref:Guanylate kinase n=1 Tax=Pararhodobacter oceanensis TaxID=2172121 RepID=A0A2T8HTF0_9RHOB|nr:guanylate kinase [Pararhodobacter oceanensis]PVH28729.1 guanylate kinase [Pararhodobacter oceanensis]